jgi:alpha-2-macroglobulin
MLMSHKNRLHVFTVILTIVGFLLNTGVSNAFATPMDPITSEGRSISTSTKTPSAAPTPVVQTGLEPEAWLDEAIDPQQFGPMDALIIRFNTPMTAESSPNPVLSWPDVNGINSWDDTRTVLTFTPGSVLDSRKTYTFFLDPSLRSSEGKELKGHAEWIVHVRSGPKVRGVSPQPGSLAYHYRVIEVEFDREMKPSIMEGAVRIEPPADFDLKWEDENVLQIILKQPLDADRRYDLTLLGGGGKNTFFAEDGSYLAEDYRWHYWQQPFDIDARLLSDRAFAMKFNYALDQAKSGQPFTISPQLTGKWIWYSSKEARFISEEPIPASQEFTVSLAQPLVDSSGLEISTIPTISFSGLPPVRLSNPDLEKSSYEDALNAAPDLQELRLEFDRLVDHNSAEKAFSLDPLIPGRFHWERSSDGSEETLVYTFSELLKLSNTYRLKIDATVLDIQGRKIMLYPYEQSFRTNAWGGHLFPTFGQVGDNIQVVDAEGARGIQFGGGGDDTRFAAYRFDLIDFAKLYADHYLPRHYAGNVRDIPIPSGSTPAATWTDVLERKTNDGAVTETLLPTNMAPGLYVVNMSAGNVLYDQLFVVLTSNTLVVKDNGDELFVWLTNINGENIPNAEIRLYSSRGEKVREGMTDENGQYRVSIPDGVEPMLVSARVNERGLSGDVALSGFAGWNSYYPYDYSDRSSRYLPQGQPYLVYVYTERPIYKPGQTVHFKAVIRKDDDVRYSLLDEGTAAKVRVLDARGNTIESLDLHTNGFGTINSAVEISEGAMLGHYQIEVEVDGVAASRTFQVEDYRKPDYQITVTSLQPEKENKFVRGEEMKVKVHASYYFGEPLANAKLDVKFFYNWPLNAKITGSLVTDANGEATLSFPAPYNPDYDDYYYWGASSRYQKIRMEVSANDGSNQVVTGIHTFSVYPASEQLTLESDGYFAQPGQPYTVTARVTDLSNQPVAGRGLTLTVHSWDRKKFKFAHSGQTTQLQTDAAGTATQELKLEAGYHQLTLAGKDPQGHKIEVTRWVYVFRNRQDWFVRGQSDFLSVSAEKDSYKPYETARFVIESTFSGPALLTFERGSVINTRMIELTAPLTIVESEIIPEHAPNVFVTVNAWQAGSQDVGRYGYPSSYATYADSYLRLAKTQIRVDSTAKALDIKIITDRQTYEPGGKLNATIQVVDSAGKPVLAELSLAVVDEAIYGLSDDFAGDIFQAFYGPRAHSVSAFDSMSPYRVIFEGGMGGGGDGSAPAARSDFPDTSAWLPVVETDRNGQAVVSIDLPDNTTSWRLSVKAVTLKHQVGETFTNIETKKDIFVRPVLPRVLTNGDQATLTAFIHNYSEQTQTLTIQLSAPGLEIPNQDEISVSLKPGEVLPVGWRVRVRSAKPTQVTITAKNAKGVLDSILLPLDLQPSAVREVQNQSGRFSGTLTLGLPLPNVERETSEVRLTLNRSMSGTLLNGLEYLTGYPYGCVEQTMSRALPNAVVANAADKLGIGGPQLDASIEPLIRASIQRLYGLQHGDGGWGWWTDDVSDPYQTAWVLFGLGVMDEAGHAIEPKVMDRATEWLDEYLRRESEPDLRTQAYALFSMAMAGRGNLERTEALASTSVYELDPFSQAALALALHELGENGQAQGILDILSQSALKEAGHAYWPQPSYDGEYHSKTMASSIRTTALVLLAYAEIQPDHALVPGIVNYLADQRQGIYGWGTTNETSFTILALTGHLVHEEGRIGSTPYEVLVNGRTLAFGTLEVGNASASLEIPLAELHDGVNSLMVTAQGDHPIYFDLATRYDILRSEVDAAGSVQVTRRYLDPVTKEPLGIFTAGQLVRVEVRVQVPENAHFMAVEDRLPGGLEALNEGLNAANQVSMDSWDYEDYRPFYWQEYGYNYKEIRADRVVFFITSMEKGTRSFTYYARATTSGTFIALPAQAYAMYDPSLWGRSESINLQIDK